MKTINQFLRISRSIHAHPLASKNKLQAYYRLFHWQLVSRLFPNGMPVPFTSHTRLFVKKGMTGATGNIYMGLHEFQEMAFLLHFLRRDDVFLDVGANVGSYTILAAAHIGCQTWAFEPIPSTFKFLERNISLNKATAKVTAFACAVGGKKGKANITSSLDTVNHVLPQHTNGALPSIEVPIVTIDDTLPANVHPVLVKIDVEGFESEVLAGMRKRLCDERLMAVIIELNASGARYGYQDEAIHQLFLQNNFRPFLYNPFGRKLHPTETFGTHNTIYLRNHDAVRERLKTGPLVRLFGESF